MTDCGLARKMCTQVTEVNKAPLPLSSIVNAGNRIVFDSEGIYIEHKSSGEWMALGERKGLYVLKMWAPRDQSTPF